MITKLVEIRDRATFIPALAVEFNGEENFLLRRAGFACKRHIMLIKLVDSRAAFFSNAWMDRTMQVAHRHLEEVGLLQLGVDVLTAGNVIDVEYILGETPEPKQSESERP